MNTKLLPRLFFLFFLSLTIDYVWAALDTEKDFRVAMSCSAFALLQTANFPETVDVYMKGTPAKDATAQKRARTGLDWTNRGDFTMRMMGSVSFKAINGRNATNGDLLRARSEWVNVLQTATESEREAIGKNCAPVFKWADDYCSKQLCISKPN